MLIDFLNVLDMHASWALNLDIEFLRNALYQLAFLIVDLLIIWFWNNVEN